MLEPTVSITRVLSCGEATAVIRTTARFCDADRLPRRRLAARSIQTIAYGGVEAKLFRGRVATQRL